MSGTTDPIRRVGVSSVSLDLFLVLIVMAIETKQFPVASIRGIVVVIVVSVMDGQFPEIAMCEFSTTTTANPGVQFESTFSIALFALVASLSGFKNYPVETTMINRGHCFPTFWQRLNTGKMPHCSLRYALTY